MQQNLFGGQAMHRPTGDTYNTLRDPSMNKGRKTIRGGARIEGVK